MAVEVEDRVDRTALMSKTDRKRKAAGIGEIGRVDKTGGRKAVGEIGKAG